MMNPRKVIFENGMTLDTYSCEERDVSIDLLIPSGHVDLAPDAHFLEHMAFQSNTYRTAEQIAYELEGKGIRFDAWTHTDRIHFHLLSPKDHVQTALQILYECFINDEFKSNEVELEKDIIVSELSTTGSNPYSSIEKKMNTAIYSGHPLKIKGETRENVQSLTPKILKESKRKLFFTWDFALGVTGDIDRDKIVQIVTSTFGALDKPKKKKPIFPEQKRKLIEEIEERNDVNSGCVIIAFPVVGIDHVDSYVLEFIAHILGGSMGGYSFSNRLFQEIRAKRGLAYEIHTFYERYPGAGLFVVSSSGVKEDNVQQVKKIIVDELEKLKNQDMGKEELTRGKTNILANEYRSKYWDIRTISTSLCLSDLYDIPWGFEDFQQKIRALTPEKIRDVATTFFDGKYFIGEIIPKKKQ